MIYSFNGYTPVVHESSFVHPQAAVWGDVVIGAQVYVGPGAAIRGDWGRITIADGCNVQENCTIHLFPGMEARLESGAHVGHGAVIHGAHLLANCLIGMNSVVMDEAVVGEGAIVGALSFVPARFSVANRTVVAGNPLKVIKEVSDEMLAWKTEGTALYQALPAQMRDGLRPADPMRSSAPRSAIEPLGHYKPWKG